MGSQPEYPNTRPVAAATQSCYSQSPLGFCSRCSSLLWVTGELKSIARLPRLFSTSRSLVRALLHPDVHTWGRSFAIACGIKYTNIHLLTQEEAASASLCLVVFNVSSHNVLNVPVLSANMTSIFRSINSSRQLQNPTHRHSLEAKEHLITFCGVKV